MTSHRNGSPPKKVAAPPPNGAATTTLSSSAKSSSEPRPQDGYTPPTADERYEGWLLAEAERHGYLLSCKCLDCSRPLTDKISVRHHRGPVCRARAGVTI